MQVTIYQAIFIQSSDSCGVRGDLSVKDTRANGIRHIEAESPPQKKTHEKPMWAAIFGQMRAQEVNE